MAVPPVRLRGSTTWTFSRFVILTDGREIVLSVSMDVIDIQNYICQASILSRGSSLPINDADSNICDTCHLVDRRIAGV